MTTVILLTVPIWVLFWKTSSFLISAPRLLELKFHCLQGDKAKVEGTMSRHSTTFEAERPVSPEAIEGLPKVDHDNVTAAAAPKARDIKGKLRRLLLAGAAVAVLAGAGWYGWDYWTVGRFLVSTDDAYVKADKTTISPKASGYLTQWLGGDNERVKAGQVLARIDDRDFNVALDQAKADVAAAKATMASKQAQLDVQPAVIDAAQ